MVTPLRFLITGAAATMTITAFAATLSIEPSQPQVAQATPATGHAATATNPNAATPPVALDAGADAAAKTNPGPVTIPGDGNMPGSGSSASAPVPAPSGAADVSGGGSRTDETLRDEALSADLQRCDTMPGTERTRCIKHAQKGSGQL